MTALSKVSSKSQEEEAGEVQGHFVCLSMPQSLFLQHQLITNSLVPRDPSINRLIPSYFNNGPSTK